MTAREIERTLARLFRDAEEKAVRFDARIDPRGYAALIRAAAYLADVLLQDGGPDDDDSDEDLPALDLPPAFYRTRREERG